MNSEFPPTRITVIEKIRTGNDEDRKAALELFFKSYHQPLVSFLVRCKRVSESEADDLVQEFMLNKVMSGKILNHDQGKGRFRNLLRVAIQRDFLTSLEKKKRKREEQRDPNDADRPSEELGDFIDRAWAVALFSSALTRLKHECKHWGLFVDRVLTTPPVPYDQLISKYGYESPAKAANFLVTAKRAFNRVLEACIQEQSTWTEGSSEEDMQEEVDFLQASLADANLLREALDAFRESSFESEVPNSHVSTFQRPTSFVEESLEHDWDSSDWQSMLVHLLEQPAAPFLPIAISGNLGQFFLDRQADDQNRKTCVALKDFFNDRAKSGQSPLPNRLDVTMAFASMAKYVELDGELADITSFSESQLDKSIQMLETKTWMPETLVQLFGRVRSQLQQKNDE